MPCYDPPGQPSGKLNASQLEAALCALLTTLETGGSLRHQISHIDWPSSGISREQLLDWWDAHKARDKTKAQGLFR